MEQTLSPELSQPITRLDVDDSIDPSEIDATFSTTCIDLISAPLNPKILFVSDEWFAPASNLLTATPPVRRPGVYVATGAWYDGWESRRHNRLECDSVIIRLGPAGGRVRGVEVDTAFFTGNYAPEVSVEGAYEPGDEGNGRVVGKEYGGWMEILSRRECGPSRRYAWKARTKGGNGEAGTAASAESGAVQERGEGGRDDGGPIITHVRLRMYPDGGIARFRLYGSAVPIWPSSSPPPPSSSDSTASPVVVELSSALNGGLAVSRSDQHFGSARNLLLPGRGADMGDGWETARSRGAGHEDWAVVSLGARGRVSSVVVDTMHFRGNFPREIRVEGCDVGEQGWRSEREGIWESAGAAGGGGGGGGGVGGKEKAWKSAQWVTLVPNRAMSADEEAKISAEEMPEESGVATRVFSHVRLFMIPDGGVKRLRVFGTRAL